MKTDVDEQEFITKSQAERIEMLTTAVKSSVAMCERIYGLVRDALPALKKLDDPAVKRLVASVGDWTPEQQKQHEQAARGAWPPPAM